MFLLLSNPISFGANRFQVALFWAELDFPGFFGCQILLDSEGGYDHHRLLYAWNDGIRAAQEDQGHQFCSELNFISFFFFHSRACSVFEPGVWDSVYEQESSTFKEIPVVIMSSENVLARIDR